MANDRETDPKEGPGAAPSGAGTLRTLALGSLALLALGLGILAYEVFSQSTQTSGWISLVAGTIGLVAAAIGQGARDASAYVDGPLAERPPSGRARQAVIGLFAVALVAQALLPLRYYLGDDRFDERFSWRMFSAVRVYDCNFNAFDTRAGSERPVPLMSTIHVAWITTLRRGREAVMERYLEWRCEQEGVEAARVVNQCTTPEGNRVPDVVRRIDCADGRVVAEEAP